MRASRLIQKKDKLTQLNTIGGVPVVLINGSPVKQEDQEMALNQFLKFVCQQYKVNSYISQWLLYILTTVRVLRTPKTVKNIGFQHLLC